MRCIKFTQLGEPKFQLSKLVSSGSIKGADDEGVLPATVRDRRKTILRGILKNLDFYGDE
jgi:hypothetical protein